MTYRRSIGFPHDAKARYSRAGAGVGIERG